MDLGAAADDRIARCQSFENKICKSIKLNHLLICPFTYLPIYSFAYFPKGDWYERKR